MKNNMKNIITILILLFVLNNQEILRVINQYRGLNHLPALRSSQVLNKTAEYKVKTGQFSHKGFNQILKKFNVKYGTAGENLGLNYSKESKLVDAFMDSPTHRANILDIDFKYIGIANNGTLTAVHFSN